MPDLWNRPRPTRPAWNNPFKNAMASTEVAIREDKDASPKSKSDSPKSKSEFLLVNSGSGEHVLETRDDTEKAEKLAQDSIAQSQERMKHEHAKQMAWNNMLIKIEAKKQDAIMEDLRVSEVLHLAVQRTAPGL